ncbi:hypothetical protein Q8F55_003477 [Vanrija albida]|uniref:Fe2OG dioxygenase domain-containing protein n=1 Tax=Vanrija albida TaxID=181172 RepID=A0ABR3Q440_9TREE
MPSDDTGYRDTSDPDQADRDAALAQLITLLEPAAFPFESYAAALDRSAGDVARAAEWLLMPSEAGGSGAPASRSAKRARGLDQWLKAPAKRERPDLDSDTKNASTPSPKKAATPPSPPDRAATAANWAALLRASPPKPIAPAPKREPPLHLATPAALAAADIPLALLPSPVPPAMAAALYHLMMGEAETVPWPKNKWYLNGREVESNHQATSYARDLDEYGKEVGVHYYFQSKKYRGAKVFPPLLAEAAKLVEEAVNAHLDTIPRYPLEYRGKWEANMCAANRYDGAAATVGFHSDQMTYLGPFPTIASLSLGTPRAFRLRQTEAVEAAFGTGRPARTYEVTLGHNSLCLMTAGCQERVPPQRALDTFRPGWDIEQQVIPTEDQKAYTTRINITFRLLRADQKAKARARLGGASSTNGQKRTINGVEVVDDDMVYFWQCQSPTSTGELKGCGFFKILDMKGEGRGPCVADVDGAASEAADG